jgi:hypothetical protein
VLHHEAGFTHDDMRWRRWHGRRWNYSGKSPQGEPHTMILTERDKDLIARVVRWEQQHGYVPASEAERRRTALQASILIEGGEGGDDQLTQLRLPDGWREANGDYVHAEHGTVHVNGDRWLHRKDNRIVKSGSGRTSLTAHLNVLASGDTGPAGTASETTESQHEVLWRALVGGPAPVRLQEGMHERLARAIRY